MRGSAASRAGDLGRSSAISRQLGDFGLVAGARLGEVSSKLAWSPGLSWIAATGDVTARGGGARERGAGRGQRAREPRRRRGRSALIRSRRGRVNGFFVGHDAARSSRRAGRFEAGGRTSSSRGGHARVERARSGRVRGVFRRARRVGEARRKRREITNAGEGRTSCRFGGTNRESLHREKINRRSTVRRIKKSVKVPGGRREMPPTTFV